MQKIIPCLQAALWTGFALLGCQSILPVIRSTFSRTLRLKVIFLAAIGIGSAHVADAYQLTVGWDINSTGQLGFNVERSTDGATFAQIATVAATVNSYTDLNLPAGTYWYRVRAFNSSTYSAYSNVASAQIVPTAPSFSTQPASQTAVAGTSVTFTVVAAGSPVPTLQWYKNAVAISGATSASLTLGSVTSADAGSYTVVATNSVSSVTSSAAVLALTIVPVAPTFSTQPVSQSVDAGSSATFTVVAAGTPAPSIQWNKNGAPISGATNATFSLSSVTSADVGTYTAVATNSAGSKTSNGATLSLNAVKPAFTTQPSSQAVTVGAAVTFTAAVNGSPFPTLQWNKNGVAIAGATGASFSVSSAAISDAGTYTLVATNSAGSVTSNGASLTVQNPSVAPSFTTDPSSQSVNAGASVSLSVVAAGTPVPALQWNKNGVAVAGATGSTLSFSSVTAADAGIYTVVATNSAGTKTSAAATLTVAAVNPVIPSSRLVRFTAQAVLSQGGQGSIGLDFTVASVGKLVLVRGIGPGLSTLGVTNVCADPKINVTSAGVVLASNDNWAGDSTLSAMFANLGAFALQPTSKDAALVTTLSPNSYSSAVTGKSGVGMIELYDADNAGGRVSKLDVRATVGTGAARLFGGFVIEGTAPMHVLIRAVGPGLGGGKQMLANPQLDLFSGATQIASNDNWGGSSALSAIFAAAGATSLSPQSKDAAIDVTLAPGTYTMTVSGVNNTTGVAQLEVYEVP